MIEKCLGAPHTSRTVAASNGPGVTGLVIVSIVALGTVVAAVTNEDTGASIPGCDSVASPGPAGAYQLRFCR